MMEVFEMNLSIEMKGGSIYRYMEGAYTTYDYDRKCSLVFADDRCVGIFNIDCVSTITVEADG